MFVTFLVYLFLDQNICFKLMDKKIITFFCLKSLPNWTYEFDSDLFIVISA